VDKAAGDPTVKMEPPDFFDGILREKDKKFVDKNYIQPIMTTLQVVNKMIFI
jgi:hypothetical protein